MTGAQHFQQSDEKLMSVSDLAEARLNEVIKPDLINQYGSVVMFSSVIGTGQRCEPTHTQSSGPGEICPGPNGCTVHRQ